MYNNRYPYLNSYYNNAPISSSGEKYNEYRTYANNYWDTRPIYSSEYWLQATQFEDYGPEPFVINIEEATKENTTFRTALWSGEYLQLTLMSIDVGEDIGLEIHRDHDQFLRIEEGQGIVMMGDSEDQMDFEVDVYDNDAIFIPAGKWHNLINVGQMPLKLYSIYAPPEHPFGTVHETKEDDPHSH